MSTPPSFAPVRRATCAVRAGPLRATAWLVSQKGLFVTSHSAVGYQLDVELEHEAGDRKPGRVVWVDVSRDVALIFVDGALPRAPEPMAPLSMRDAPAVKSGDRVFTVTATAGRGLRIAPAFVCTAPRQNGPEVIEIDAPPVGPAGGPLVDHDCRVVGLLVTSGRSAQSSTVLPVGEIRGAIRSIESAPDLPRRTPMYRCPACLSPFVPEHDACLACGVPLPHPFPASEEHPQAERTIREVLAMAGIIANRARTGPRSWRLVSRGAPGGEPVPIDLSLDQTRVTAILRAPIALAPRGPREPFYRLLLTLNDQTTGPYRLALAGEHVVAALVVPLAMLQGRELAPMLAALGEMAEHYRKILSEGFDCEPLTSLDDPPEA